MIAKLERREIVAVAGIVAVVGGVGAVVGVGLIVGATVGIVIAFACAIVPVVVVTRRSTNSYARLLAFVVAFLFMIAASQIADSESDVNPGIIAFVFGVAIGLGAAFFVIYQSGRRTNRSATETNLGFAFASGQGVRQDYAEAATHYRKAAEQGYAPAQYNLALMHACGQGLRQDYAEAAKWFRRAAEWGYAPAQHFLGLMYARGYGVPEDRKEAASWYDLSAKQDYDAGGDSDDVEVTWGTPHDFAEAQKWCRTAVQRGGADRFPYAVFGGAGIVGYFAALIVFAAA